MEKKKKTNLLIKNHTYYSKVADYSEDEENDYNEFNEDTGYNQDNQDNQDNECSICFDVMNSKNMKTLACGHKFHEYCIDSWIKINPICPYCREYMSNHFDCSIKYKYLTKKCKIYLDEEKFSKIIIDVYTTFIDKPTKQYIIPTTYVRSVENIKNICFLYFKETNKGDINKYTFVFSDNNNASQLSDKLTKIFNKFYEFYKTTQIFIQ